MQGYGSMRIAKEMGLNVNTVKSYCRRHGYIGDRKQMLKSWTDEEIVEPRCKCCGIFIVQKSGTKKKMFCSDCPSVKPPVGIKVRPVLHADLLNDRFINAALPQHLFLGFFPDTPFPVLTPVVVCHSLFPPIRIFENVKIQIGKAANGSQQQKQPCGTFR